MPKNCRNNRGQTTLFVIFGIAIVAIVAAFIFLMPQIAKLTISEEKARVILASEKGNVENYVKDCVKASALKNINTLGRQGGRIMQEANHFSVPVNYMGDATLIDYAYYYDKELNSYVNNLPSLAEMKRDLDIGMYNDISLMECLQLKPFQNKFFVTTSYLNVYPSDISLGETNGKITIPFKYPVMLELGGVSTTIDDYSVSIPINLVKVRDAAGILVNTIAKGGSLAEVDSDIATMQALDLRQDSNADTMTINAVNYKWIASDSALYNANNDFYTITYTNPNLDKPYIFNLIIGSE